MNVYTLILREILCVKIQEVEFLQNDYDIAVLSKVNITLLIFNILVELPVLELHYNSN